MPFILLAIFLLVIVPASRGWGRSREQIDAQYRRDNIFVGVVVVAVVAAVAWAVFAK